MTTSPGRLPSLTAVILVSSALAGAAACSRPQVGEQGWNQGPSRYCTDRRTGVRVPESECAPGAYHGGGVSPFLFYYLGTLNSRTYVPIGGRAFGGGYAPVSGVSYRGAPTVSAASFSAARAASVSARGGFGGIGAGMSAGE